MSDINTQNNIEGNNPIDKGKKTIDELFEEYKRQLRVLTFISTFSIKYNPDEYILPKSNKFLYQKWNRTYIVDIKKGKLNFSLKANFIITNVKECTLFYNDKSGKLPLKYYLVTLKNANGKIEKDVEIVNNSKSDYKQFQADINSRYNDFSVNMTESEFKTFVAEFISPKIADNTLIYTNAGVLEQGKFLYENALATKDGIIWADEKGYIQTGENTFIKMAESTHYLPKLAKSTKTGNEIAHELMTNIVECWSDDIIIPLMTLGHMIMSVYFEEFVKRYGVPTLILFGETGTGKSTLVTVGLSIFGMPRDALSSGGSTAKSNEYFSSKYNGMVIGTDDVKGQTLNSTNFTALVKGAYKAIPRHRMLPYGRGVENIHICSPLAYSTNDPLPNLLEVVNRLNIVEIFGKVFKADKFKYHEIDKDNNNNLKELSLILPEMLKFSFQDVLEIYEMTFKTLEESVKDTQKRVINNIAYAYTGALLLLEISNVHIDNLAEKFIAFANLQVNKYENLKNVVDRVLAEIPILEKLQVIKENAHFKIVEEDIGGGLKEPQIRFHKGVILSAINKYYSYDKSKRIDEDLFTSYAKNHPRFKKDTTVRYDSNNGKPVRSMCFSIAGLDEYSEHCSLCSLCSSSPLLPAMSYQELAESIERYNGNSM